MDDRLSRRAFLGAVTTGAVGAAYWFDEAYEVVLPSVAFVLPVLAGLACAALGGGLVPSLALGAAPSLAWAVAVVLGRGLGTLLGTPLPLPDSPLWAIAGAFLLVGLVGALVGFLGGRVGRLAWRRIAS